MTTVQHPMIDVDGVMKHRHNSEGRPIHPTEEGIRNFHRWFGDSKAVDAHGRPLVLYHGTTKNFSKFDPARFDPESDHGAGIYASSSAKDSSHNYASEEGQDLVNKMSREFEAIADDADIETEKKSIRARHIEHGGAVLPLHMRLKNPVIVGAGRFAVSTRKVLNGLQKLHDSGKYYDFDLGNAQSHIFDNSDGTTIDAKHLISLKSGPLAYASDENGNLVSSDMVRKIFQHAGHDGVIDHTVGNRFHRMNGIAGATHYVAFSPAQVKSATGNTGGYSIKKKDVRESSLLDRLNRVLEDKDDFHQVFKDADHAEAFASDLSAESEEDDSYAVIQTPDGQFVVMSLDDADDRLDDIGYDLVSFFVDGEEAEWPDDEDDKLSERMHSIRSRLHQRRALGGLHRGLLSRMKNARASKRARLRKGYLYNARKKARKLTHSPDSHK